MGSGGALDESHRSHRTQLKVEMSILCVFGPDPDQSLFILSMWQSNPIQYLFLLIFPFILWLHNKATVSFHSSTVKQLKSEHLLDAT